MSATHKPLTLNSTIFFAATAFHFYQLYQKYFGSYSHLFHDLSPTTHGHEIGSKHPVSVFHPSLSHPWLMVLAKCLPIFELIGALGAETGAARRGGPMAERLVGFGVVALFFSLGGDFYLALDDYTGRDLFKTGLISFLLSHVCYMIAFGFSPLDLKAGASILGLCLGLARFLILPHVEKDLQGPILVYIVALAGTWWRATTFCRSSQRHGIFEPALGGMLFVLSDLILAYSKFVHPVANAGIWVMGTYYLAQYYLVKGLLRGARGYARRG